MGKGSPKYVLRLGDECQESSSPVERDLKVLSESKLNVSVQCALEAKMTKHTLECIRPTSASQVGLGLSCSVATLGALCVGLGVTVQKEHKIIRENPQKGYKYDEGCGGLEPVGSWI